MTSMRGTYAALCCYYGQWPAHFQCWLSSCGYNPQITFWLVTDISMEGYDVPENVKVCRMNFKEVVERIRNTFPSVHVCVDRPYKLCDFKTAYGTIFHDLFEGYDYWGYYDIDTIWGDIAQFIPDNEDGHLVKIFPCGHLSFIRNIAPWNKVYELVNHVAGTPCRNNMEGRQVATWQDCFSSPESHYYDEEGGLEPLFAALDAPRYDGVDFDNLLPPWRFDHFLSINYPEKSNHLVYGFDKGHLYRYYLKGRDVRREEVSYVHFSKRIVTVGKTAEMDRFCLYPSVIDKWRAWTYWSLLLHGRKRYVRNLLHRIRRKIGGK